MRTISSYIFFCSLLISLVSGRKALAIQDTILLDASKDAQIPLFKASMLMDSTRNIDASSILSPRFWNQFKSQEFTNSQLSAYYWMRFTLRNQSPEYKRWCIELVDPHITEFELYEWKDSSLQLLSNTGYHFPFSTKAYHHKNFIYEVNFEEQVYKTYLIRFKSKSQNSFTILARKADVVVRYSLREYYLLGLFYGVLLVMALYNLFLFFSIRELTYLYYVGYIISCALVSFSEDGTGFQYLWPEFPTLNIFIGTWNPIFFMLIFVVYASSFLRLRERQPLWYKSIWAATGAYLLLFLYQLLFAEFPKAYIPFYLIPFGLVYLAGVYALVKGKKSALYFVLAYSFIFLSIIITFLRTNGWGDVGFLAVYSFNFGFFFEVLILTYAMSERFKEEKLRREAAQREMIKHLQEREKFQEKLNRELESRVQERTAELEEANLEISRMNQLLSEHNLALQQDVKQISLERITQQEMSFEEFSKIYPDENACYDYLAELKWSLGYRCKKCGNLKFNPIGSHSRRCNKCKYIESVTAFTIFHSIKFPIQHAFYMLFIINIRKDIKPEELSSLIPLSEKSCGSFKRKVQAAEKSVKGKSKGGWERLIFFFDKED
ncbi:MAG: transposase [Cytophagaceae bacterium]|jgi:hypothetical protein|nr:transposase [Cytophagaceae bacterium]